MAAAQGRYNEWNLQTSNIRHEQSRYIKDTSLDDDYSKSKPIVERPRNEEQGEVKRGVKSLPRLTAGSYLDDQVKCPISEDVMK